jgi:hypothetical protein
MTKPSHYTPELAELILNRIMEGEMLTKICSEEDLPARLTFYAWMRNRPDLVSAYARARLAWADWWAERVLAISLDSSGDIFVDEAGKAVIDHANVQRARLQADSIKWLVGKYAPRTYGDKPVDKTPGELKISWEDRPTIIVNTGVPRANDPPKQLEYHEPQLPADLSEEAWSILVDVMELIRRTIPSNSDRPPQEIFGVLRDALRAHFSQLAETSSA